MRTALPAPAVQHMPGRAVRTFLLSCLCLLIVFCTSVQAAGPFRQPFSYYADHQDVSTILMAFARTQGYTASVSPGVKGTLSARFQKVPPADFLSGMQEAFNVNWYILGGTLSFYSNTETQRIFLSPKTGSAKDLCEALRRAGVFSPQLPPTLGSMGELISVSGPPAYLTQIQNAAAAYEASQTEKIVMRVFPLKYAWAEDMTVSSMDKTVTVPGVASILRAMVMGSAVSGTQVTQQRATVEKLGGTGLSALGKPDPPRTSARTEHFPGFTR